MVIPAPRFALGTVQWGMPYGIANRTGRPGVEEVRAIVDLARSAGIDTLDTARAYGQSEATIGEIVGISDSWRVVTKLAPDVVEKVAGPGEAVVRARASLAASHAALRRDALDVVLLHRAEHRTALGGAVWDVLREGRNQRRIGRLGVSVGSPDEAFEAIEDADVEVVQVASSLLDLRLWRSGFFEAASRRGVEVFVRSVFLQGVAFLARDELSAELPGLVAPMRDVAAWASARGCAVSDTFLVFARDAFDGTPVLGCEAAGQLGRNLETWRSPRLTDAEIADLAAAVPDIDERWLNPARWGGAK